ncbi:SDR family NAD(P)-dependent oxidoreductase [Streptomyces albus]|uniref:SDR family NAD(P)-dependent oxidoreductase n=1 Tax=Streptomyces albus TaxID=1888 RepID=UPI00340C6CFC
MTTPEAPDRESLRALTEAVRALPGVHDAVAVPRKDARTATAPAPAPAPAPAVGSGTASAPTPSAPVPADLPGTAPDSPLPLADLDGGEPRLPDDAPATLQEGLRRAARLAPDKGTVYITEGNEDTLQTYAELLAEAERVLSGFRAAGLRPGDAALFVFDDNRGYLTAFWACVLGGFVPTPVAVATTYTAENEANRKLRGAWQLLGRPVLVTDAATAGALAGVRQLWDEPGVRILTVEELADRPADHDWFPATPDSPVLNLLTSGSTGVPKCVQHTNASVVARSFAVAEHCGLTGDDVSLIWMPFDHVTVAFYNVRDVFLRCLHVNAKISHFLSDPLLWFDWADRYRATNTWAPNFAMALVNERAAEIAGRSWDLSCLREITNGGEPVVAATSHRFLELLAPHGLPTDAMVPAWGMSETCSGVTYSRQSRTDRTAGTVAVDPASLGGTIRELDPADEGAVVLSRVGRPIPGVRVRVVDEDGGVLPEGRMGELRITGRTLMAGYFGNEEANREAFDEDGWFRTGDLAFVRGGEVVIAGRRKDQIIVRGINYMAHELESVVERVGNVRVTFSAATGIREPGAGTDQLVVFHVPVSWDPDVLARTREEVRAVLVREAGVAPDLVVPVTEAEFPKTANGKIQRSALVTAYREGAFADRLPDAAQAARPREDTWFCTRQWVRLPESPGGAETPGVRLVLAEDEDLSRLEVDGPVVAVGRGTGYAEESPWRYRLDTTDREQIRRMVAAVTAHHGPVAVVVHALPLSVSGGPAERLTTVTREFTALLAALTGDHGTGRPLLLAVTSGALRAAEGDRVDLGTCALTGLVRTAVTEVAPLPVRQLDLPAGRHEWAKALRAELADRERTGVVAAREGRRLERKLSPVPQDRAAGTLQPVTPGGLYLVTGGLGGIAHDLAGCLLATFGVRLLLVGRSPVAAPGDGTPGGTAAGGDGDEKAARLAGLSQLGQVAYAQLDVADATALEAAVAEAEDRWGRPLDGVLHLAAADPTGQWADLERHTLVNETPDTFAAQYRAKVEGTLALARVLEGRPHASLLLFGSVNGEFGGHSFGAYAAASSFLTGFTDHWHHERRRRVRCLAWSQWSGVGMNRGRSAAAAEHRGYRTVDADRGLRLFLDAAALPDPYLVVGLDLDNPAIVEELAPQDVRVGEILLAYVPAEAGPEGPEDTAGTVPDTAAGAVRDAVAAHAAALPVPVRTVAVPRLPREPDGTLDTARLLRDTAPGTPRRNGEPPREGLETGLAAVWAEALGRTGIGRGDSFFELGGNSLRATRLLALTAQRHGVRLSTQQLYENPTVAGMAALIARHRAG